MNASFSASTPATVGEYRRDPDKRAERYVKVLAVSETDVTIVTVYPKPLRPRYTYVGRRTFERKWTVITPDRLPFAVRG